MTGSRPAISVLVPVYNMASFVEEALVSVLSGDFADVELIVVDDGSTDGSSGRVREVQERNAGDINIRLVKQPNQGKPAALNRAIREARGAFMTVLDPDDQLTADSLKVRHAETTRSSAPRADFVIGGFDVLRDGEVVGRRPAPEEADPETLRRRFYLGLATPFHFNACLLSRELIRDVGPFDERLQRCQDGDYAIRCLERAEHVRVVPTVVYRYRKHRERADDRIKLRVKTARHRTQVLWKNFSGLRRPLYVAWGALVDLGKLVYELFAPYNR